MKDNSLIYKNSLLSPNDFVDTILSHELKEQLPTFEIEETKDFYYIHIDSFYDNKHILEISYKNNFLILDVKDNNISKNLLLERIFYLLKIDLNNILLHEFKNSIKLIIPKAA